MRIRLTFFIAIFIFIQGCATAPIASLDKDKTAKSFKVLPNKSNLYIYRNESFGGGVSMDVAVNGKDIGSTAAKTYFMLELNPGNYQIQSKSENTSIIDVILKAGENTFIWQEVKMGVLYARTKLAQVDISTGQKGVLESKLIATAISENDLSPSAQNMQTNDLK